MVKRARWLVPGFATLVACGPLLGLDDMHDRVPVLATPGADAAPDSGSPDMGVDAANSCTTNAQCIAKNDGFPALCVRAACVPIDKEVCLGADIQPSPDAIANDNVALFAAFLPIDIGLSQARALTYILALRELQRAGGIPGAGGGPRRDLAMVVCASEPEKVERAVNHVVRELRLPAMLAGFDSSGMTTLVQDVAVPDGVFTLNPGVVPETLKHRDVQRLVWNLLGPAEDVALAYRPLLARVEKYLAVEGRPLRVAMVTTKDTSLEASLATVMRTGAFDPNADGGARDMSKAIVFNGLSASANGASFLPIQIEATENTNTDKNDYAALATELSAFRPDVVIALTRDEIASLAPALEQKLTGLGAPLPFWVLGPRAPRYVLSHLTKTTNEPWDVKRKRFVAVQYNGASDPTQRDLWLERMADEYPQVDASKYKALENYYDAVYWLAYGFGAAGPGAPLAGASFRDGVRAMLGGPAVIVPGPKDAIGAAFSQISQGRGTTFVGALGRPDIDVASGTWNSVGNVLCFEGTPSAPDIHYDAIHYDRTNNTLLANETCFVGF